MRLLRGDGPPLVVGHRGAAALAPENTIRSLEAAIERGADAVEFDVLGDADGRIVLAHSLHELPRERATLDEALRVLAATRVGVHVDVKQRGLERPLLEALRAHTLVERSLVSCLDAAVLRELHRLEPELALGLAYPEDRFGLASRPRLAALTTGGLATLRRVLPHVLGRKLERAHARAAVLHHAVITRALVSSCHARGVAVFAWTVNDPRLAERLVSWGADAIITDDPGILARSS